MGGRNFAEILTLADALVVPASGALRGPAVEVRWCATDVCHVVDRARPAEDLSHRPERHVPLEPKARLLLRHGAVGPVRLRVSLQRRTRRRDVHLGERPTWVGSALRCRVQPRGCAGMREHVRQRGAAGGGPDGARWKAGTTAKQPFSIFHDRQDIAAAAARREGRSMSARPGRQGGGSIVHN